MIPSGTNRSQVPFFYALTNSNRTSPLADSSARNLSPSRRLQLSIDARSSCSSSLPQQRWYIEAILPRSLSASAKSIEGRRADSKRFPAHYECAVSGCRGLHGLAIPAYVKGFLFPALPTIAGYCVRVRVKLGSARRGLATAKSIANQSLD